MYDILGQSWNFSNILVWVEFGLSFFLILGFILIYAKLANRKSLIIIASIIAFIFLISWFFGLKLLWVISGIAMVSFVTTVFIHKTNELHLIAKQIFKSKTKNKAEKVFDRHAVCQKIAIAVENLSRTKTGALISFEKKDKLNDFVKSGTVLNSPIIPELLVTIFYPGTRLHDGAVVIRKDQILAASVYYTPTTKPLTGKFGSRHRAAIGISEVSDAVTVIVSEETGRISIAYRGELIHVQPDNFLHTFEEYVFMEDANEEDNKVF